MIIRTVVSSSCLVLLLAAGTAAAADAAVDQKAGTMGQGMGQEMHQGMPQGMGKGMHGNMGKGMGMMNMHSPDSLKWGPAPSSLPKGAQLAVLQGDPMKEGPYVIRLKLPAGYKVPPHSHSKAESLTIISGSVSFGAGETMDPKNSHELKAGGFYTLGANENHFAMSRNGAVVQIQSEGPFDIKYVNPADNPESAEKK